ncbi:MAG: hypothetical protein JRN51_09515 [Nitrososphaerota archaeon]|nr:hypothetical protein [Nitrososphaerota archaeon]
MRRHTVLLVLFLLAIAPLAAVSNASTAPYAKSGAFASYTAEGGFIEYFQGVLGNITYNVLAVYPNGSMLLHVYENITAGQDLPQTIRTFNSTDSVSNPQDFPAVSLSNLSSGHIFFQNVSSTFVSNDTASVPAGLFDTMKFSGTGPNDTTYTFWFDRGTGLVVEESSGTSAVELESSNIAVPIGPPSGLNGEIPYELVFVLAFAIGGGLFFWMRHHYGSAAQKKTISAAPKK